jgi:hypothetical protein
MQHQEGELYNFMLSKDIFKHKPVCSETGGLRRILLEKGISENIVVVVGVF